MTQNTYSETIFAQAIEIASPQDRAAFLDRACLDDPGLRQEVERLVGDHFRAGGFLEKPIAQISAPTLDQSPAERPGTQIGPYKLLQQIGEGGFGVVYLAEQHEPVRRKVALKILKPGMDTREVVARFEAERQALAIMDHPNIAKVLDGGATASGRPYFVMELVKGVPITDFCDQNHLTPRQRLELFIPVCQAVQHAHQKGIIHRDLKPTNVLVSRHDTTPVPKVIDFGVAKALGQELTDKTLFTGIAQMIGTPLYMSPEQAGMSDLDVDTRSDIYSLGVLLYELLTGSTPFTKERFKKAAYDEIRRIIRDEDPPKPSTRLSESSRHTPCAFAADGEQSVPTTLASIAAVRGTEPAHLTKLVRGELDWIVMKALEKDRSRRYETASGFAADIQRYLQDEPVQACPPSSAYRFRKFARRNKVGLAVATLVLVFLASLGGVAGWAASQNAAQRKALEEDIDRDLAEAGDFCRQERLREATALLDRAEALAIRSGDDENISGRVAQLRKEVEMAAQLAAIRLDRAAEKKEKFDGEETTLRYAEAFREYGLDPQQLKAAEAAVGIERSAIREQLIAALDDWLPLSSGRTQERLLALMARADGDPWRRQLRVAFVKKDLKTLRELAQGETASAQPPATSLLLGRVLKELADTELAADILRRAQEEHPGDFWLNEMLGVALMEIDRPAEAAGYLRTAVALRPDSPGALSNLGACLNDQGNNTGAIAAYHKTIAMSPNHVTAHLRLGNALKDQGDLPGALAAYQKTIALRPDYEGGYNNVGLILNGQGDLPGAVAAYRKAIALKSDNPIPYYNLGLALEEQGDIPGAVTAYRKAIALKPDYTHAHFALGRLLHKQGDFAALEELRRAWELGSKDSRWRDYFRQSLSMLTPAYVHWRQVDKAAADKAMADLWASPEFVDQLNFEAWRLRRDGYLEQARELRADVVDAARKLYPHGDPRAAKYQSDYIQLLLAMQRYDEAATVAGDALQSLPSGEITSRLMILRSLVKLYEQWKKPEEAQQYRKLVTSTEAAILPAELTAASLNQLNLQAYQLRQHGLFEEALELRTGVVDGAKLLYPTGDPRLVKYQNDYVDLLIAMKRYEEGKTVADNVLNSLPAGETTSRLGILRSLAHLHAMWNKPEEAERYRNLVKSTEAAARRATVQTTSVSSETGKEPEPSAQSLNDQAWSLATAPDPQMRDPQTAVKQAQQAVTLAPNTPDFWNTLGVAQYRSGNFKEAIPSLMKYRELRTSDAEYSNPFFLAMAHQQLGNKDEALQWYNRAVDWMEKKQAKSAMMLRTQAEAAELLGIEKEP